LDKALSVRAGYFPVFRRKYIVVYVSVRLTSGDSRLGVFFLYWAEALKLIVQPELVFNIFRAG
jgi:hypothetical protein